MKLMLLVLAMCALGVISFLLKIGLGALSKGAVEQPTAKTKPQAPDNPTSMLRLPGAVLYTVIFALLLGVKNLETIPLLWGFLAVIFVFRLAEAFTPAVSALKSPRKEEDQSRWTTFVIALSFVTNAVAPILEYRYGLANFINFIVPLRGFHEYQVPSAQWWNWLGLLLLIVGLTLRLWAIQQAGAAFAAHVKVDPKHKLVTTGPYALMRHPSYLGTFLSYLGIAVSFESIIGAVALAVLVIPTLIFRLRKEEQLLSNRFGEAWKKYQSQTPWRLIPNVW